MPDYRLILITADGRTGATQEFRAKDDEEAIGMAEHRRRGAAASFGAPNTELRSSVGTKKPDAA
jgi:hypothetical protein